MMKQKLQTKWFLPPSGIQRLCAVICVSSHFEFFIYFVIICNVVVLAMPYNGMTSNYRDFLDKASFTLSIIYNLEALIKLTGLRLRYFHDRWNIMDLLIVIGSDVGFILK